MSTSKKELLQFCRYYKGEENCPKDTNASFWDYEKYWVSISESPKENSDNFNVVSNWIDEYLHAGLGLFCNNDGVPITLKALLLNRYEHWQQTYDGFKDWYMNTYKKEKE